jgi:hypothetical protein
MLSRTVDAYTECVMCEILVDTCSDFHMESIEFWNYFLQVWLSKQAIIYLVAVKRAGEGISRSVS